MNFMKPARLVGLSTALALTAGLVLGGPAVAADENPGNPVVSTAPASPEPSSPPIDLSAPGVTDRIAEIEASGGQMLGGSTVSYSPEGTPSGVSALASYPSGCYLTVLIYKQTNQIVSDNLTACTSNFVSAAMSSTIGFLAWEITTTT